eukprot:9469318-Pyramimonas_sp.AAC.2
MAGALAEERGHTATAGALRAWREQQEGAEVGTRGGRYNHAELATLEAQLQAVQAVVQGYCPHQMSTRRRDGHIPAVGATS